MVLPPSPVRCGDTVSGTESIAPSGSASHMSMSINTYWLETNSCPGLTLFHCRIGIGIVMIKHVGVTCSIVSDACYICCNIIFFLRPKVCLLFGVWRLSWVLLSQNDNRDNLFSRPDRSLLGLGMCDNNFLNASDSIWNDLIPSPMLQFFLFRPTIRRYVGLPSSLSHPSSHKGFCTFTISSC